MASDLKTLVQIIGLIPAVLAWFKKTPDIFTPSPALEPEIQWAAVIGSVVTFIYMLVHLKVTRGPTSGWDAATRKRRGVQALVVIGLAAVSAAAYYALVRMYPYSSTIADLLQIALWSAPFMALTYSFTVLACIWMSAGAKKVPAGG